MLPHGSDGIAAETNMECRTCVHLVPLKVPFPITSPPRPAAALRDAAFVLGYASRLPMPSMYSRVTLNTIGANSGNDKPVVRFRASPTLGRFRE